jgi:Mature-T-Cell Proliferation I type
MVLSSTPRSVPINGDDDNNSTESSLILPPEQIHCRQQACAIQYCLNRFNHQEKKCRAYVEEWKRCRDMARKVAGWEPLNDNKK